MVMCFCFIFSFHPVPQEKYQTTGRGEGGNRGWRWWRITVSLPKPNSRGGECLRFGNASLRSVLCTWSTIWYIFWAHWRSQWFCPLLSAVELSLAIAGHRACKSVSFGFDNSWQAGSLPFSSLKYLRIGIISMGGSWCKEARVVVFKTFHRPLLFPWFIL